MAAIGLAVLVIGIIEIAWWHRASTDRLFQLFAEVKADNGLGRPTLLRENGGAWDLVFVGLITMAFATFAPYIRRHSSRARTTALVAGIVFLLYVVVDIGGDTAVSHPVSEYIRLLGEHMAVPGATPADFAALWPPAWYSWFEDLAQGALAIGLLVTLIALASAAIDNPQPLVVRHEPTDQFGRALRRFVDDKRAARE
jgi:hypothetical protein